MPTIRPHDLRHFAEQVISAKGSDADESQVVADSLVEADLTGHPGHGVSRLPRYSSQVDKGQIKTNQKPTCTSGHHVLRRYDAHFGFGQSALDAITREMMALGEAQGLSLAFVQNCNHVGRLAYYTEAVARSGMCALMLCNVNGKPRVSTFGGIEPRLGTNPLALAVPWRRGVFSFDSSTSSVVEGITHVQHLNGVAMPPGMLIDANGNPTCDPGVVYSTPPGSILPLGLADNLFKGAGLAMAIDVFAGLLSGSGFPSPNAPLGRNGIMLLVFNANHLLPQRELDAQLDAYAAWIKSARRASGVEEILLPGEPEKRAKSLAEKAGITLDDGTYSDLLKLQSDVGMQGTLERLVTG
ncbi:MAG: Ldh family oxidoreductase [Bdellovibrionota bacterium]